MVVDLVLGNHGQKAQTGGWMRVRRAVVLESLNDHSLKRSAGGVRLENVEEHAEVVS